MAYFERKQVLVYVVMAAMVAGFAVFRYLPLRRRAEAVAEKKATQSLLLTENEVRSEQLSALESTLSELGGRVGDYDARIPREKALGGFLENLSEMMNEHGLGDQEVAPGAEIEVGNLGCIPLDLHCTGKLEQLFEFCRDLQALERLVRIEQVMLSNDDEYGGEVTMQTKAVVYYRKETRKG
jgi:type IV pilus assembly protein PilO